MNFVSFEFWLYFLAGLAGIGYLRWGVVRWAPACTSAFDRSSLIVPSLGGDPEAGVFGRMQPLNLSLAGRTMLRDVVQHFQQRGVAVYYALLWFLSQAEHVEHNRAVHQRFMEEVRTHLPVLPDDTFGLLTELSLFFCDELHLSPAGAKLRARAILRSLAEVGLEWGASRHSL